MLLERTSDYNLPSFIVEHIRGAMKMAIAENYYSLGDKEKPLHWYNVRFNILNAGDEIMVGYSFLRRAELCEELERLPEALNFYKKFLDLYRNSDPKYSDWVKEATDGLSRIMRKVG